MKIHTCARGGGALCTIQNHIVQNLLHSLILQYLNYVMLVLELWVRVCAWINKGNKVKE